MKTYISIPETSMLEAKQAFPEYEFRDDFLARLHEGGHKSNPILKIAEYGFVHFVCPSS